MRPFIISIGTAALAGAVLVGPGHADGNRSTVTQVGTGNAAAVLQQGDGLSARLRQAGRNNVAIAAQSGDGHRASVGQRGDANTAVVAQSGDPGVPGGHIAIVRTHGTGHVAVVEQSGSERRVDAVIQVGDATGGVTRQVRGGGPVTVVIERGSR